MSTERLTAAEMHDFGEQMLADYNRHDVEAVVAHLTDDVVWTEPTLVTPARGRDAVRTALKDTFTAFPDLEVLRDGFRLYPDAEHQSGTVTWSVAGTMTGPMEGIPATGRMLRMSGVNVVHFRHGLISEYTFHYDALAMMQMLGLLPKSTGLGFKAIVMADVMAGKAMKVLQRQ